MNKGPLVSLTIPTYQGEKFLEETLSTALAQTYPHIEIIISDDGSKDDTLKIARRFQEKSPFEFRILTHHRLGIVNNWNFCISMSKGQYIKFLFQDDLLRPDCVEAMVNLAEKDKEIGMVFSPRGLILSQGAEDEEKCMSVYQHATGLHRSWSDLQPIQPGEALLNDRNLMSHPLNKIGEPSTVLIRKEVFDKVGLFDNSLCQLIDVDMWLRIMTTYKIGFIDEKLSYFRVHPGQQTLKNIESGELILDDDRFLTKILTHPCYGELPQSIKQEIYRTKVLSVEKEREDTRVQLERAVTQMQELENEVRELKKELQRTQQDYFNMEQSLFCAKSRIEAMETSKFWKARKAWFKVKRSLNLPINE